MRVRRSLSIVFESGLGDGLETWADVVEHLDPDLSFVAYSRPGYGDSGVLATPDASRDSAEAAALLRAVLRAVQAPPPYILVGHSLGGLYVSRYAADYPASVAGLVYVDGRPPRFRAACDAHGIAFCSTRGATPPPANWPAHILAEADGVQAAEEMAPAMSRFASIPATIITSTRAWPGEQGAEGFALWLSEQEAFARGFAEHRFVRAEGSGHYIQREDPVLVAREIERLARQR